LSSFVDGFDFWKVIMKQGFEFKVHGVGFKRPHKFNLVLSIHHIASPGAKNRSKYPVPIVLLPEVREVIHCKTSAIHSFSNSTL
jgi:hypothetical protein